MGLPGKPGSDEVQKVVVDALKAIGKSGKASGILTSDVELARQYEALGVGFLAVGSDVGVLTSGLNQLLLRFRDS
jgi:4-hydroxy-2-oxoheptanedioate aldolase